ncbi:MAG TPA: hypothetical protein VFX96_15070, partial [Pyrinomonadaceae bacterium]|nr:hypothetical protein [Pyrinomonadaceae bacterium]
MSEKIAPYGSWKSPITADLIVGGSVALGQVAIDGEDTYWVEGRPTEDGRNCVVRRTPDGRTEDITPREFNARTRVHEYGGGDYTVREGTVYFTNFTDQRVYRQTRGAETPAPVTPEGAYRYADMTLDRARNLLYAVREDHTGGGEPENTIVALRADGDEEGGRVLVSGNDFYYAPR